MADDDTTAVPFAVKDCALAAIATGVNAHTLKELMDGISAINPASIYYHFWGGLLRPRFDEREYNNDFAIWTQHCHGLHDSVLAERLGVIDPTDYIDIETLRHELVELMEERLEESERLVFLHADEPFQFIHSQIVVFNTRNLIDEPHLLAAAAPHLSIGSVFYHFIDARRRTTGAVDDFRAWLRGFGDEYADLCEMLAGVDPYFVSLSNLRLQLTRIFQEYFGGRKN